MTKEEKEAEKAEKRERKRELNRKKRQEYRSRQRMKKSTPKPSAGKRQEWQQYQRDENKRYKKEKQRQQKEEHNRKKERIHGVERCNVISESMWEGLLEKALDASDFEALQKLFVDSLTKPDNHSAEESDQRKRLTQRYRRLSVRFHPDKHADDQTNRYKVAFQALNEARDAVVVSLLGNLWAEK